MSDRNLPSLTALRAFEATARLGSLSRAAAELHVTHGAVSRQIRLLEDAAGLALFQRHARGMQLTRAGAALHAECSLAFERLHRAWQGLHPRHGDTLVLGCSGSILARWMLPRLPRLNRDLPQLTLRLAVADAPFDSDDGDVQAALALVAPPWPAGWRVHELAAERIGPVFSPRLPDAATWAKRPAAALVDAPLLHTASRPQAWPEWAAAMHLDATSLPAIRTLPHLYFLLEAASAGLGIAIAPEPLVADDLAAGRLLAPWGFRGTAARWVLAEPPGAAHADLADLVAWLRAELVAQQGA